MSDEILLKVMSSSIVGIVSSVIVVKDDGVHLTFEGAATLFANNNLHIPFENISSINTQKKMLGLVYTLVITEISGKTHEVRDLKKDDALNASKFILEMKAYTNRLLVVIVSVFFAFLIGLFMAIYNEIINPRLKAV